MGRAQSDTYSSLFTKSDNVNLDETFDRKSVLVHVLRYRSNRYSTGVIFIQHVSIDIVYQSACGITYPGRECYFWSKAT